jgi:hypothetical protein
MTALVQRIDQALARGLRTMAEHAARAEHVCEQASKARTRAAVLRPVTEEPADHPAKGYAFQRWEEE